MSDRFETGDILRFRSIPTNHYAVYIGGGEIVHYNKRPLRDLEVHVMRESLEEYKKRSITPIISVDKVEYSYSGSSYAAGRIRSRALRCLGRTGYNIVTNNCEHFATWCVYGKKISENATVAVMGGATGVATATGAGTGAVIGGIVGSVVPVAGTAAGAFVGTLIGSGVGFGLTVTCSTIGWFGKRLHVSLSGEEDHF